MKLLLIYNPQAGFGRAKKLLPEVKKYLSEKNISAELIVTTAKRHGQEVIRSANFDEYDGLISCGGDGTMFELLNGYYQNKSQKRPLIGLIPTGTGNSFARELDLYKKDWKQAIDIIANGNTKKVDVGRFRTNGETYYFLNIIGFGFVSDVNKSAQYIKVFGNMAYILGVFYQLVFLRPYKIKMETGNGTIERENLFVEVSNSTYTGTTFLMAPNAEIDDGLCDVTLLGKVSRRRLLKIFPTIFDGTHINQPEVETFKVKKVVFESSIPKILTPDGELLGSTPLEIECLKQDIEMYWK